MNSTHRTLMECLTLYYDGRCPLCQAEILFLQNRNTKGLLQFVDLHAANFDTFELPVTCDQAMSAIHGRFTNGTLLSGVKVFEEAYRRTNLPLMAWLLSRRWLIPIWNQCYAWFAKNRYRISKGIGPTVLKISKRLIS
jgi:predicted DCC family thiol-disulfide oxidoreductase YuxK